MKNKAVLDAAFAFLKEQAESPSPLIQFDYNTFNEPVEEGVWQTLEVNGRTVENCGTLHCVAGTLPYVTGDWAFSEGSVYCTVQPTKSIKTALAKYFDIDKSMAGHLFFPELQRVREYGGKTLEASASLADVEANFLAFYEKFNIK